MDRRTFLKSASMKGTAIVTASAVGTEMLHAAESIGASDVASGKRNAPKAKRLPEDLQELVKDSSLLRKPDNLTVAILFRIIMLLHCMIRFMGRVGRNIIW